MRELDHISFLRETSLSRLMRELLYPLPQISNDGLAVRHISILFADDYWKAMEVEIFTLESIDAWEVVDREDDMNVINSTWAFKCKHYPDGLIKKFKARFCARGDQQLEGIDFFETYAPVVQWTTICLMFVLEVLLNLKSL